MALADNAWPCLMYRLSTSSKNKSSIPLIPASRGRVIWTYMGPSANHLQCLIWNLTCRGTAFSPQSRFQHCNSLGTILNGASGNDNRARGDQRLRPQCFGETTKEGTFVELRTMDGIIPAFGAVGMRILPDLHSWPKIDNNFRYDKIPKANSKFLAFDLIFDLNTADLQAVVQDAYLQQMRIAGAHGVAADSSSSKEREPRWNYRFRMACSRRPGRNKRSAST